MISFSLVHSQELGSIKLNVDFQEQDYSFNRDLYLFIPEDYDPANEYTLVVGFRGGPHSNAGQFRDQLAFLSDSINAIILCPENQAHFWNQETLVKQLFNYAVDTVSNLYNIDPQEIYLTGLSYGGRHAVIVAMDKDAGGIPAIKGVIPFAAGSQSDGIPEYQIASQFAPSCICIGLNDSQNFISVSRNIFNNIETNNGKSFLNEISNVGHTVDFITFPEEMMSCINFIDKNIATNVKEKELPPSYFSVLPNVSKGRYNLFFNDKSKVKVLQLLNSSGKIILTEKVLNYMDISIYPDGVYFLKIITVNGIIETKKIVKNST